MSRAQEAQLCSGTQHGFVGKVPGWNRLAWRAERGCQALTPQSVGGGQGQGRAVLKSS